jgi:hypothetical protein
MVYAATPPYEVLQTNALTFCDLQRIKRFARYHDVVVNSGKLAATTRLLMSGGSAFASFLAFSDWLWATTGARHGIAQARLAALVRQFLVEVKGEDVAVVDAALLADLGRDRASSLTSSPTSALPKRQRRHARDKSEGADDSGADTSGPE